MKKQQETHIQVLCTRAVADEMCRYDGATIVKEELVDSRFDAYVDSKSGVLTAQEIADEKEQHRKYRFTIRGTQHTFRRWASFGVSTRIVEEPKK
jgi:hypothetical protein